MVMELTKNCFLCEGKRGADSQFGNVWESIEPGSEQHSVEISIQAIWFQDDRIFIRLASGEERSMPLEWFPRLSNASPAEREQFELSAFGIHWPSLDEDLSFEGFYTYSMDLTQV